jgi:hypothetical protein
MFTTLAACCLVSHQPGVSNGTTLNGRFDETVKCSYCDAEYRLEYSTGEAGRIENYEVRLRAAAQRLIDRDHPEDELVFRHTPIIGIDGLPS